MSEFKVGDKVKFIDDSCVSIAPAKTEYPKVYTITSYTNSNKFDIDSKWDLQEWCYKEKDFELVEGATTHSEYYTEHSDCIQVGGTIIKKAKRRSNGKEGYIIKQEGASQNVTAVTRDDLLALAAVLADIDAGVLSL